jgi:carbon storage regulator CsrA
VKKEHSMLVLSWKCRESVVVAGGGGCQGFVRITVLGLAGGKVKLGFKADAGIPVLRMELWQRLCAGGEITNGPPASESSDAPSLRTETAAVQIQTG